VNLAKNKWYSHGEERGGNAVSLVCFLTDCDFPAALAWIRSRGFSHSPTASVRTRVVCTYPYRDENGVVLYNVDRIEPKCFSQWREIDGERVNGVSAGWYARSALGHSWIKVRDRPRLGSEVREFFDAIPPVPYRTRNAKERRWTCADPCGRERRG
jgi:hypothetical protein